MRRGICSAYSWSAPCSCRLPHKTAGIHRMESMTFRQNEHETTDEFVNRARHSLCDFGEPELVERIIELIVASTPHELLQKHLLNQDKGCSMGHVLTKARKYEATIVVGKQSRQSLRIPHHTVNEVKRRNVCMNCALSHPPRQCPAYTDHCMYCDAVGLWDKCCWKKITQPAGIR